MSDRSIFDHRTISSALNEAFNRVKDTNLHVKMAVLGRDDAYVFTGSARASFYANGIAVDLPEAYLVVPYTSILFVEIAKGTSLDASAGVTLPA